MTGAGAQIGMRGGAVMPAPLLRAAGSGTRALALLGAVWTCGIVLLICAEVVGRSLFNSPIAGLTEMVSLSVTSIMFLQLPAVVFRGKLFRVELFTGPLDRDRPDHALFDIAYAGVLLALLAMALPWTWGEAVKAWISGDFTGATGAFELPTWPFRFTNFFGCAVTAAVALCLILRGLRQVVMPGWTGAAGLKAAVFLSLIAGFAVTVWALPYNPLLIGSCFILWLFVFLLLGFPISTILLGLSVAGIWLIREDFRVTEVTLGLALTKSISSFEFAVVPLFVAMGLVLEKARMGEDAFAAAAWAMRGVRGGLGVATVLANAVFASVVGSSIASAAVFSRVAVGPMMAAGYPRRKAVGTVAGSSVLGMLIPPSLLLIVYGLISEQSIGKLFVAAVLPGLALAGAFALVSVLIAPRKAASVAAVEPLSPGQMVLRLAPMVLLVVIVLGGIYSGWFTPTEAAGVGLFVSILIALARRSLNLRGLVETMFQAGLISAAMLILMAAAGCYTRLLAFAQIPMQLNLWLSSAGLEFTLLMVVFVLIVLALGAVLDSVSIILIIAPIMLPLLRQFGADPIWFGILLVISVEVGLLTPPFGMSAYTVKEVLSDQGVTLSDIFIGALPFVLAMLAVIALLIGVPGLATALI